MTRWRVALIALGLAGGLVVIGALLPAGATSGSVAYALDWDTAGMTLDGEGSWTAVNDLGYQITVTDGALTIHSVTLVSCPHTHGLLGSLMSAFGPGVAFAGHTGSEDPALLTLGINESLTDLQRVGLGSVTVHEPAHCQGHIAWGATPRQIQDEGLSTLSLEGTYLAPGASVETPFDFSTNVAWGTEADLGGSNPVHLETGDPAEVTVVLSPGSLFDGVALEDLETQDAAYTLLRNLADGTTFTVTEGFAH